MYVCYLFDGLRTRPDLDFLVERVSAGGTKGRAGVETEAVDADVEARSDSVFV